MASELVLFQVSSLIALIGMSLGWRGIMTKYSGFYDLPTAWSMIFWGILVGGFYGKLAEYFLLSPYVNGEGLVFSNLLICLALAVVVHLMLRRAKVRKTGSQPTTGWALGLAVGGMVGMFFIYRILERYDLGIDIVASVVLVAIISPRAHALIFCHHGHGMLMGMRWRVVLRTFIWCSLLITTLYTSLFYPLAWIFIIPVLLLAEKQAPKWVWAAIPKPARRRLRRIWADAARSKSSEEE